jgi:hypothetical protein
MLQQHTRTTRGLGPVVALGLAIAAISPATGLAKPAGEPYAVSGQEKSAVSQNLVTPDARDSGTSGSAGTVSPQNLVSPDARDAGSVASGSQSLVTPDARDAAAGRVVSSRAPAPAPVTSSDGIEGWDPEIVLGLGAALLMGLAGVGLLVRARMQHHPRPRIS